MKKLEQLKPMKGEGEGGKTKVPLKSATGTDPETQTIRPGKHAVFGLRIGFAAGEAV